MSRKFICGAAVRRCRVCLFVRSFVCLFAVPLLRHSTQGDYTGLLSTSLVLPSCVGVGLPQGFVLFGCVSVSHRFPS